MVTTVCSFTLQILYQIEYETIKYWDNDVRLNKLVHVFEDMCNSQIGLLLNLCCYFLRVVVCFYQTWRGLCTNRDSDETLSMNYAC